MTDCVMIVGLGPNDVVVPISVCKSTEDAEYFISHIVRRCPTKEQMFKRECLWWKLDDIDHSIQNAVFSEYYGGCGECLDIVAVPIEFEELQIFPFNLD